MNGLTIEVDLFNFSNVPFRFFLCVQNGPKTPHGESNSDLQRHSGYQIFIVT